MKEKTYLKRILGALFVVIMFLLLCLPLYFQSKPIIDINEDILRVYYFNVGQADCTLAINKGQTLLIDGGKEANSPKLIDYIKKLGIKKLDYVIATHPDKDHIAGLDKIIKEFNIGVTYMPITDKDNKEIQELKAVLSNKQVINPSVNDEFYLGNAKCTILNSGDTSKVSDNNSSIVVRFRLWKDSMFIYGRCRKGS